MAIKLKDASAPEQTPAPEALVTENVKVSDLKEYGNNPRKNDAAVPDMVKLIERFGFRVPILKKGNRIVDGHLRVKAARQMGLAEIPAIDVGNMSQADERALRIALNKSVEWAEWDQDKLAVEFDFIKGKDLDLGLTGFGTAEITKITKAAAADVDKASKALATPPKNKDADAGKPADPAYVSVTFHMAASSRDGVMAALEIIRKREELANASQALVHIANEINEGA